MTLSCPKCHGAMRTYERNRVHLDQCTECRGLFLDRGELERLIDAEAAYYDDRPSAPRPSAPPAPAPAPAPASGPGASASVSSSDLGRLAGEVLRQVSGARSSSHSSSGYGTKRKKSFLEQILN